MQSNGFALLALLFLTFCGLVTALPALEAEDIKNENQGPVFTSLSDFSTEITLSFGTSTTDTATIPVISGLTSAPFSFSQWTPTWTSGSSIDISLAAGSGFTATGPVSRTSSSRLISLTPTSSMTSAASISSTFTSTVTSNSPAAAPPGPTPCASNTTLECMVLGSSTVVVGTLSLIASANASSSSGAVSTTTSKAAAETLVAGLGALAGVALGVIAVL